MNDNWCSLVVLDGNTGRPRLFFHISVTCTPRQQHGAPGPSWLQGQKYEHWLCRSKLVFVTLAQADQRPELCQCVRPPDRCGQPMQLVWARLRRRETQLRSHLAIWQSWKIDEQLKCGAASDVQGRANGPNWSTSRPSSEWQSLHLRLLHTTKWGVWPCQSFSQFNSKNMDTWKRLF